MSIYLQEIERLNALVSDKKEWGAISPEYVVRMKMQNRFRTGIEIARYTADIMRRDMAAYDDDSGKYTQSLGCWHGFIAQQVMMAVKRHQQTTERSYIYLSGWISGRRNWLGRIRIRAGWNILVKGATGWFRRSWQRRGNRRLHEHRSRRH